MTPIQLRIKARAIKNPYTSQIGEVEMLKGGADSRLEKLLEGEGLILLKKIVKILTILCCNNFPEVRFFLEDKLEFKDKSASTFICLQFLTRFKLIFRDGIRFFGEKEEKVLGRSNPVLPKMKNLYSYLEDKLKEYNKCEFDLQAKSKRKGMCTIL